MHRIFGYASIIAAALLVGCGANESPVVPTIPVRLQGPRVAINGVNAQEMTQLLKFKEFDEPQGAELTEVLDIPKFNTPWYETTIDLSGGFYHIDPIAVDDNGNTFSYSSSENGYGMYVVWADTLVPLCLTHNLTFDFEVVPPSDEPMSVGINWLDCINQDQLRVANNPKS